MSDGRRKRPCVPDAHLQPDKILAHERTHHRGGEDQQKHARCAGKLNDSETLTHSALCGQDYEMDFEDFWKSLPIENLDENRRIVVRVACALHHQNVPEGSGHAERTDRLARHSLP
jgi:hypothetical protein